MNGNTGNDLIRGHMGCDNITGGSGDDTLIGSDYNHLDGAIDTFYFSVNDGAQSDTIMAFERGLDRINIAGYSNARITSDGVNSYVLYGESKITVAGITNLSSSDITGINVISGNGNPPVVTPPVVTPPADVNTRTGTDNGEYINDQIGNNTIYAAGGNDSVETGNGNDYIDGGNGDDSILSGAGDDSLVGGYGNDTLRGDDGNDLIRGHMGCDFIIGGRGDDTLIGSDYNHVDGAKDTFFFSINDGVQSDTIMAFERGIDVIYLSGFRMYNLEIAGNNTNIYCINNDTNILDSSFICVVGANLTASDIILA